MKNSNNVTYIFNRYHAAKVISSAYLTAYLHDADIKTLVHDKFTNQILEKYRIKDKDGNLTQTLPVSSEDKERLQILSNCFHYFTNFQNKERLDLLKQLLVTDKRDQFYNELIVQKKDQFYNDLIAQIVVLPEFIHAYTNGLSVKDVYNNFEKDIRSNTKPQDIEKRQLLENCLDIFESNRCKEKIDQLIQQSRESNPKASDIEFAEAIWSNLPEISLTDKTPKAKFAEIALQCFINAYTNGEEIKTVFERFKDKLTATPSSPENSEKMQVLSNCLCYFTNPNNKEKLASQEPSAPTYEKDLFYNELFTEIIVLPEFAHAYANGLDVNDVYKKFEEDIPRQTTPQTIERRQLLANCLSLFKNDQYSEEVKTIRQRLMKSNPRLSDIEFSEAVSENFPEIIFGTNLERFAKTVLPFFTTAYTNGDDIKVVFDRLRDRLPSDNTSLAKEKRAFLEKTLDHFKKTKNQQAVGVETNSFETTDHDGQPLPAKVISEKILEDHGEALLGDQKRRYDMSSLYSSGATSSLKFVPVPEPKPNEPRPKPEIYTDTKGNVLIISKLGALHYLENGFLISEHSKIDKYAIAFKSAGNTETRSAEVFTNIDFDKLYTDEDYYNAFVNELFSQNNISLSNACNYVGSIVPTTRHFQNATDESEIGGIYQYQVSQKYALEYDYIPLSAVVDYTRQQEQDTNSSEPKLKRNEQSTDSSGR